MPKKKRRKNPIGIRFPYSIIATNPRGLSHEYFLMPAERWSFAWKPKTAAYIGYSPTAREYVALRKTKGWELRRLDERRGRMMNTIATWKGKPRLKKRAKTLAVQPDRKKGVRAKRGRKPLKKKAKKKVKKNPQLMIVTNPRMKTTRINPAAIAAYKNFHGTTPAQLTKVEVPAGTPKFLVELGKAHLVEYKPTNRSQLADKRARQTIMKHRFGKNAMVVTDPSGKFIGIVNPKGTTRVSGLKKGERKVGIIG